MILYFECFSGISGDMSVASLLDLGADKQVLMDALNSLNIDGYTIEISAKDKCGIFGTSFDVILEDQHTNDDGIEPEQEEHNHQNFESEEHTHHQEQHKHSHENRNIEDIEKIIDESNLTDNAKNLARKIFNIILRAEAKAHNKPENEVRFHEIGAVDSIVDIVGVAVCIDNLGIKDVIVSTVYEGQGHVKCAHGIMPVPVPAVVNIFNESNLNLRITNNKNEMVTPTGAAILAALKNIEQLPEEFKIIKSGIGIGKKNFENANILRTMIIEEPKKKLI